VCCCPISKLFQSFWEVRQAKHLLLLFLVYSVWTCNKHWCEGIVFWWWVQLVMLWNKPLSNPLSPPWSAMAHLTGFLLLLKPPIRQYTNLGRVNQQPPMHQLAVLSTGWAAFFHSAPDGVHHNPFFFWLLIIVFFYFIWFVTVFSPGPDLTHSYLVHFPTLVSITPTLVPYLLSPTNIATLLITYLTNLTIVLNTYPTNLTTLHTQPPYWHKYFTNLVPLIRQLVSYVLIYLSN